MRFGFATVRRAAVVAAAAALAACAAEPVWVKEGATRDDIERDVADCRFLAQGESRAEQLRDPLADEVFVTDTAESGRLSFRVPGTEGLRFLREGDLFAACMEERGYTRVPAAGSD